MKFAGDGESGSALPESSADRAPPSDGERRFTNREFALIMRKAFELEEQAPKAVAARDGLTLAEMRSIAAEVGLDPEAVAGAVALVPVERAGAAARLLGETEAWTWELWLDSDVEASSDIFLQTIRRVLRQRGEVRRMGGVVEWKSVGRSDHVWVRLAAHGGRTVVDITGDRRPSLLFAVLTPLLVWGAIGAAIGLTTSFAGAAVVLPVAAVAASYATARLAWRSSSRRLRSRLERLALALRTDAARLAGGRGDGAEP
jgi:hypothetical protein